MRWFIFAAIAMVLTWTGVLGAGVLLKPRPTTHHPDFGADCRDLLTPATRGAVDCVRVLYGTNRDLRLDGEAPALRAEVDVRDALAGDSGQLHLGRADVWLPKLIEEGGSRDRGETPMLQGPAPEEPSELAKYVFLTRITKAGSEAFVTEMSAALEAGDSDSVLLFVHGFNTQFEDALIRSAQLSVDLSRRGVFDVGVPTLFSWPSAGKLSLDDYRADQDRSLAAAPYLEAFLDVITANEDVQRVNIVAHSMGNRILTEALKSYAQDYLTRPGKGQVEFRIVLVAADVERDVFNAAAGVLDNLEANVTIYTSDADRALHVSGLLNRAVRLGDTQRDKPYIRANPYYETVDATGIATELFGLGHNYYSDNPFVLGDILCALAEANPELRALERRRYAGTPDGDEYFRVSAAIAPGFEACSLQRTAFPLADARAAPPIAEPQAAPPPPPIVAAPPPPPPPPQPPADADEAARMRAEMEARRRAADAEAAERSLAAEAEEAARRAAQRRATEEAPPPAATPPPPPPALPPVVRSLPPPAEPALRYERIPDVFLRMPVADRDRFLPEAYATEILPAIRAGAVREIRIEAHSDGTGDRAEDRALSQSWANAMRDWLIAEGVDPSVIVEVVGHGGDRPLEIVEGGRASFINQRIEVRIAYEDVPERALEDEE